MSQDSPPSPPAGLINAAIYFNSFRHLVPWARSTGFRTNALRHRSRGEGSEPNIAEEFLVNTRLQRHDREGEASVQSYFSDPSIVMLSMLDRGEQSQEQDLKLPTGVELHMELGQVIRRRRSGRSYTGDTIEAEILATLLRSAAGVTCRTKVNLIGGGSTHLHFRTVPSGGGLYPVSLFMVVLNVTGIPRGIYRYDSVEDRLLHSGDEDAVQRIQNAFAVPETTISVSRANAVFLLIGQPWRGMRKYGSRGMRYLFLEAGAMAQTLHMATAALGYGSVDCASIYDDEVHEALGIDGVSQTLLHTIVLGNQG